MDLLLGIFIKPFYPVGWQRIALLLPLCLTISVVYKTTRCERVREIPLASLVLWITIVVAMFLVGGALLLLHTLVLASS